MAFDPALAEKVRQLLSYLPHVEEKRMFSGVTFMVNGKMCVAVGNDHLMCRIDPRLQEEVLKIDGVRPVIMRGRIFKGYVYVSQEALQINQGLSYWIGLALEFNQRAKASARGHKK